MLRALVACFAGAVLAACSNGAGSTPRATGAAHGGTAGIGLGPPSAHVAATDELVFNPATQMLHVGDIVQWTNTGTIPHTVAFDNQPNLTDPSTLTPGDTWEVKVDAPGTYFYYCSLHPGMTGKLVVTPATAPSGRRGAA